MGTSNSRSSSSKSDNNNNEQLHRLSAGKNKLLAFLFNVSVTSMCLRALEDDATFLDNDEGSLCEMNKQ